MQLNLTKTEYSLRAPSDKVVLSEPRQIQPGRDDTNPQVINLAGESAKMFRPIAVGAVTSMIGINRFCFANVSVSILYVLSLAAMTLALGAADIAEG